MTVDGKIVTMRFAEGLLVVLTVVVAAGVAVIGWWLLAPYEVYAPRPAALRRVLTPIVRPGDLLLYAPDIAHCKIRDIQGTVRRSFVDGLVFDTPPVDTTLALGACRDVPTPSAIVVPRTLPAGFTYYIEGSTTFQVNPLRTKTYHFRTEPFTVVAP